MTLPRRDRAAVRPELALRHPLFWAALAALLVNDHLLKGAGVLPAAVTGKLSDVAGLVVAPLVLAALLRVRTERGLGLSLGAVGLVFAAINLSPAVGGLAESAMGFAGWRVWSDPTDLVALPALALAWNLAQAASFGSARGSRATTHAALALGAFACIATSSTDEGEACRVDSDCVYTVSSDNPLLCCTGTCIDMEYDSANCGACGNRCASGTACNLGRCEAGTTRSYEAEEATPWSAPSTETEALVEGGLELPAIELDAGRVVISNATRELATWRIRRVAEPAALDCGLLAADPELAAPWASFGEPEDAVVASFGRVALDARAECDAAWIEHPEAGSALVVHAAGSPFALVRLAPGLDGLRWVETEGGGALSTVR